MSYEPLFRLIYASSAPRLVASDFENILSVSENNNKRDNITGALVFSTDNILQVLEGARSLVSKTYGRISTDDRHRDIVIISAHEVERRIFPGWSMRYFGDTNLARTLVMEYSISEVFEPSILSASSATDLAQRLSTE